MITISFQSFIIKYMQRIHLEKVDAPDGFSLESAKKGEFGLVLQKAKITADDPHFYMYINQLENLILSPAGINGDSLTHFCAILHNDNTADIYVGYNRVRVEVKPNRDIPKDSAVYANDIVDIRSYMIEEVELRPNDSIVCVMKVGWKYGLYFDLTGKTSAATVWPELGQLYTSLHLDRFIDRIQASIKDSNKPHILTEGKTDWKHLEAARRVLEPEMLFGYPESEESLGDEDLVQVCERLSKFGPKNKNKIIAIFDRDNPKILKKLKKHGDLDAYQEWGNNIYSVVIAVPEHRKGYSNLCIELLYKDNDISKTDHSGKRLYFDNELKIEILPGQRPRYVPVPPNSEGELSKKPFDGLSSQIQDETGNPCGLSKAAFAELVLKAEADFKIQDYTGFKKTFDQLKKVLRLDIVPPSKDT